MTHLREHWEGVSLAGNYTLEQSLGGDDRAAYFQTAPDTDGHRAVVKLVPEAAVEDAPPLDLWHRIRQLRHPNLVDLLAFGRADHEGQIVFYAAFESPDETLAAALSRSPLDPRESREVLDSVLDALRYLHAQGLVIGVLDADHVVAVGDRIKLSTAALRYADTSSAYREDVRLLGRLWQQHLMNASPKSASLAAHAADPNPQTRWTLAEISAALGVSPPAAPPPPPLRVASPAPEPPPPASLAPTPAAIVPPVLAPVAVPVPISAPPAAAAPLRARNDIPTRPPSQRPTSERAPAHRFPKWIFVAAAGVLLLILGLLRPRPAGVATQPVIASRPDPAPTPPTGAVPEVAPTKAAAPPTVPKPSPTAGKEMWRVIAFTYRTRVAAEKKVQQLNQYHPGLNATVFSPKDRGGYYLVSLGGRMTHEAALRVQRSARGKGLPRDLFVQNYSQ
jgi:hypothetical protein